MMLQYQDNANIPSLSDPSSLEIAKETSTDDPQITSKEEIREYPNAPEVTTPGELDRRAASTNSIGEVSQLLIAPMGLRSEDCISLPENKNAAVSSRLVQQIPFTPIKQKQQRSNFLSPGMSMLDNMGEFKDNTEGEKINYPYGTKISALSQIKRRPSEQFDESLLQLTKTLKARDGSVSAEKEDSLVYSNGSISNIFITPIKMTHQKVTEFEKQQTDHKTAKTSNCEFQSPNAEHHDETQTDMKEQDTLDNPRSNPRKDMKPIQEISSKTLSNPSKLNRGRHLYHSSLGKSDNIRLKEAESKRKLLQKQLELINGEINTMKHGSPKPHSNLIQRINISDDINAKMKAIELVHRLNNQKKQRQKALQHHISEINRDAFGSYDEIIRLREEREQRDKEKKRIDAIQRMKLQEIRKNQAKKLQKANVKFLKNVIWGGESAHLKQIQEKADTIQQEEKDCVDDYESRVQITKEDEKKKIMEEGKTPELDSKKSKLKKIRNLENSQVKSILEEYNALLFRK